MDGFEGAAKKTRGSGAKGKEDEEKGPKSHSKVEQSTVNGVWIAVR